MPDGTEISAIPGMIAPIEKQMLLWAARDHYAGLGEIVELGTFLGTSTECLSKGLRDNIRVRDRDKRIHCYDLFVCDEHNSRTYGPWLDPHHIAAGDSFLPVVEKALRPYRSMLTFNAGDILHFDWVGRPIEVLFIDMGASWLLSDHILRTFFSGLMPTRSVVIHQDYFYQRAPWLSITMEYLADYFDIVGNADCSMVFHQTRPIPDELLRRGTEGLSPQQKLQLNERVISRLGGIDHPGGGIIAIQRGCLLAMLGDPAAAKSLVETVLERNKHPTVTYRGETLLKELPTIA